MESASKKLEKAKVGLILYEPFFATIALRMEYVENPNIPTCGTNGKKIVYNPDFINNLPPKFLKTLLCHEILHIVYLHHLRIGNRDKKLWNMACDYAINPILQKSGFELPQGSLIDYQYEGMGAEQIYSLLQQNKDNENNGDSDGENDNEDQTGGGFGTVEQPDSKENLQELEQEVKQMIAQAQNTAKQAGKMPSGLSEIIANILEPKKDWRQILHTYIAEVAQNDYSWVKPNPRYMPMGLYLPHLFSLEIGKVVFVLDTSSSVDSQLLQEFGAELKEACSLFSTPITIIHCDTKVQKVEEWEDQDELIPVGRGGTEFQPAFDYINENMEEAKAIVYFTDGKAWGKFYEPNAPVIWCIYDNKNFKCDFGEIINIK